MESVHEYGTITYFPGCSPQPNLEAVANGSPRLSPASIDARTDEFFDPELPTTVNQIINLAIHYRDTTRDHSASPTAEHQNHGALFVVAPDAAYDEPIAGQHARYSSDNDKKANLARVRGVILQDIALNPGPKERSLGRMLDVITERDWEIDGAYLLNEDGGLRAYGAHLQVMQGELVTLHPGLEGGARTRAAAYTSSTLRDSHVVMLSSSGSISYWNNGEKRTVAYSSKN